MARTRRQADPRPRAEPLQGSAHRSRASVGSQVRRRHPSVEGSVRYSESCGFARSARATCVVLLADGTKGSRSEAHPCGNHPSACSGCRAWVDSAREVYRVTTDGREVDYLTVGTGDSHGRLKPPVSRSLTRSYRCSSARVPSDWLYRLVSPSASLRSSSKLCSAFR